MATHATRRVRSVRGRLVQLTWQPVGQRLGPDAPRLPQSSPKWLPDVEIDRDVGRRGDRLRMRRPRRSVDPTPVLGTIAVKPGKLRRRAWNGDACHGV